MAGSNLGWRVGIVDATIQVGVLGLYYTRNWHLIRSRNSPMARRRYLNLERLEDRTAPAVFGQPWPMPTHVTLSFAPDGTQISGQASDLFRTLDAVEPAASWQATILEAVQAWTSEANVNVGLVADGGEPFGTPGSFQGDPRFGDIRIGADTLGLDSSALGFPPDPYDAGTWGGDIVLNDQVIANATSAQLYAIVLHELGHSFGFPDNTDPNSVMSTSGLTALAPEDVAALQALYGPPVSSQAGNNSIANALPIPTPDGFNGNTPIVAYGTLSTAQPALVYSFAPPQGYHGAVTVRLVTSGVSLLDPLVTVYDGYGDLLGSAESTRLGGDAISVQLGQASLCSTCYVEVQAATPGSFDSGRFGLAVSFDAALQVSAPQIDTVLRAPDENLTADQINQLFQDPNPQSGSTGSQGSQSQLIPAISLTTTPGFALDTRFQAVTPLNDMQGAVDYSFVAPAATGNDPLVFTAGLNAAGQGGSTGSLELLNASGTPLPATVLLDAGGVYTIQATGLTPGATYYLCATPPVGASNRGGYSIVVADFLQTSNIQTTFETNTLSTAAPQHTSTLFVARSQFFQFQLSVPALPGGANGAVEMTILDANGNTVLGITATAGQAGTVSCVMLAPGQYTVEFSAVEASPGSWPALSYTVQGGVLSQPMGIIVHSPTYQPIYLGPPGPVTTYLYPNGKLSTIPFLWVSN
jgi:hypothetical protein